MKSIAEKQPHTSSNDPVYFPVSVTKLVVMSLCSFGIYQLYWFYKNWRLEMARTGEWGPERHSLLQTLEFSDNPFWRTFWTAIYSYSLFSRIKRFAEQSSIRVTYSPLLLAVGYWVYMAANWVLPTTLWWIYLFAFVFLLPVQGIITTINEQLAPHATKNEKISGANVVVVVIGGAVLALAFIGTYIK